MLLTLRYQSFIILYIFLPTVFIVIHQNTDWKCGKLHAWSKYCTNTSSSDVGCIYQKKKARVLFYFRCWPAHVQSFEPTSIHNSKIRFQIQCLNVKKTSFKVVSASNGYTVYVQYDKMRCYLQANESWGSDLYLDVVIKTVHHQSSSHLSWGLGLCRRYSAVFTARVGGAGLERGLRTGGRGFLSEYFKIHPGLDGFSNLIYRPPL